jgi:hypothetical protein
MSEFNAAAGEHPSALPGLVYRDRHETSLTLLVLGFAVSVSMAALLAWSGGIWIGFGPDELTAVTLTLAFTVLWLLFWSARLSGACAARQDSA